MNIIAEYIWIDGADPTRHVRSKTKIVDVERPLTAQAPLALSDLPEWGFDGSSTGQASGGDSDRKLMPVCLVPDPVREGNDSYLVLCEVLYPDGRPHETNTRAHLRAVLAAGADKADAWVGIEQEYTLFKGSSPLGFGSERRFPAPQGPYYCGVGADEVYGRQMVERHLRACLRAGLNIVGVNAEVMPGQWEFQVGGPNSDPLTTSDHLWLARWLLYRVGEDLGISATLDAKPVTGDWNGAGAHTNFSTAAMRADGGMKAIVEGCEKLRSRVREHLAVYGEGYEMRLTGRHETCRYDEFKYGVGDRTASVRIPAHVGTDGKGYLEDRRPCANADPYQVTAVLLETIVGVSVA
ncbi:MAG: glutamine synthetase beta-grasp domain-containing protein [Myxococcales bacterium]|nr:glutamine synthetase beta-grasp domain-containing protein [Myxococcales bacterium]